MVDRRRSFVRQRCACLLIGIAHAAYLGSLRLPTPEPAVFVGDDFCFRWPAELLQVDFLAGSTNASGVFFQVWRPLPSDITEPGATSYELQEQSEEIIVRAPANGLSSVNIAMSVRAGDCVGWSGVRTHGAQIGCVEHSNGGFSRGGTVPSTAWPLTSGAIVMLQTQPRQSCALQLRWVSLPRMSFSFVSDENRWFPLHEIYRGLLQWFRDRSAIESTNEFMQAFASGFSKHMYHDTMDDLKTHRLDSFLGAAIAMVERAHHDADVYPSRADWRDLFSRLQWDDVSVSSSLPTFDIAQVWLEPYVRQNPDAFWLTCNDYDAVFWRDDSLQAIGNILLKMLPTAVLDTTIVLEAVDTIFKVLDITPTLSFCGQLPVALAVHLLSLSSSDPSFPPRYALYFLQSVLMTPNGEGSFDERLLAFAAAPWPLFALTEHVAAVQTDKVMRSQMDGDAIEAAKMLDTSVNVLDDLPVAFAPLDQEKANWLADSLRVTHTFMAILGVDYIAIAGTLLGALRHMDRIPWDDDVDLCFDIAKEHVLVDLILLQEARRLGLQRPMGTRNEIITALSYLEEERHVMKAPQGQALVFEVQHKSGRSKVDLWLCWGLQEPTYHYPNGGGAFVALMSLTYGPKIQRDRVVPSRRLPFGDLAIWGPSDPNEVVSTYVNQTGWGRDWRSICRGKKVHGRDAVLFESKLEVPCSSLQHLFQFAAPWSPLPLEHELQAAAFAALQQELVNEFPGFDAETNLLSIEIDYVAFGAPTPPRLRARTSLLFGPKTLACEALIWQGGSSSTPSSKLSVRSLDCDVVDINDSA